jgi:hypothetical protein
VPYALEGDRTWLDRWGQRTNPSQQEFEYVRPWLDGLTNDPHQWPSAASSREHPFPMDELRGAFLIDAGSAFVAYAVDEDGQVVRILHIGNDPPEGVVFPIPT